MIQPFRTKGLFSPSADRNPAFGVTVDDPAAKMARENYLEGLRSPAPLNWLSNHLKEDQSNFGPVFVAVKVLKNQAASATMKFFKWHPDARAGGDQEEKQYLPRNHEICRFFNRPNPLDKRGRKLVARMVEQYCLTGSAINWRVDDIDDKPCEMWNVQTGLYTAIPPSSMYPVGGYRIMPFFPGPWAQLPGTWQAAGIQVPADQMAVVQSTHPLTYKEGLSPLAACAEELDTINGIGRARKSIIKRAPIPSGVIELDSAANFPDKPLLNRIMAQVYNFMGGPERAGKPAMFGPGMTWKPFELQGIELPWTDSWDQLLSFVFAVFGVTKSLVGMNEDTSYAALYASLKQFNLFSLCPLLDDIADVFNVDIIERFWGEEYGMEFETQKVGDDDLLEKQLANDLPAGIRKRNEWRKLRNLTPLEGPEGEELVGGPQQKEAGQPGAEQMPGGQNEGVQANGRPKGDPAEKYRPRNISGGGSLPSRIMAGSRHGNGKSHR